MKIIAQNLNTQKQTNKQIYKCTSTNAIKSIRKIDSEVITNGMNKQNPYF